MVSLYRIPWPSSRVSPKYHAWNTAVSAIWRHSRSTALTPTPNLSSIVWRSSPLLSDSVNITAFLCIPLPGAPPTVPFWLCFTSLTNLQSQKFLIIRNRIPRLNFESRKQEKLTTAAHILPLKSLKYRQDSTRACLIISDMPNSEEFFCKTRQIFAGILTDGKKI